MQLSSRQRGLTLIETMISLILGLFLVTSLITVFISGNRTYRQDLQQARMQESARFALKTLAEDLSMMGFFGNYVAPSTGVSFTLDSDCGPEASVWALDMSTPIAYSVAKSGTQISESYSCIDDAHFVDGTDVLSIKRVEGLPISRTTSSPADDGMVFLRSSPSGGGSLVLYDKDEILAPMISDWRYLARLYYIRNESLKGAADGIPTLYRKELVGSGVTENDGGIARGIEYFHLEFGIDSEAIDGNPDTRPDGAPNYYLATPDAVQLSAAVTARIHVLARSRESITGYTNTRSYRMGAVELGPFDDGFYRRVFSTTVHMRNIRSRTHLQHILDNT
jgi:type IV pilus assembly protein PilW